MDLSMWELGITVVGLLLGNGVLQTGIRVAVNYSQLASGAQAEFRDDIMNQMEEYRIQLEEHRQELVQLEKKIAEQEKEINQLRQRAVFAELKAFVLFNELNNLREEVGMESIDPEEYAVQNPLEEDLPVSTIAELFNATTSNDEDDA